MTIAHRAAAAAAMLILASATGAEAAGSPGAGRATFQAKCAICHKTTPRTNSVGPALFGVFGRAAGAAEGYRYSDAMAARGLAWTDETLDAYLQSPAAFVPGNKMNFPGVPDAGQRADIIAFLKSLKDQ